MKKRHFLICPEFCLLFFILPFQQKLHFISSLPTTLGVFKKTFFNAECAKKTQRTTELKHYLSAFCGLCEKTQRTLRLKDFDFLEIPWQKTGLGKFSLQDTLSHLPISPFPHFPSIISHNLKLFTYAPRDKFTVD